MAVNTLDRSDELLDSSENPFLQDELESYSNGEKPEELKDAEALLKDAAKNGVITLDDQTRIHNRLKRTAPGQLKTALRQMSSRLKAKENHLQAFTKKLENAPKGVLDETDKKKLLKEYKESDGKKRQEFDIDEKHLTGFQKRLQEAQKKGVLTEKEGVELLKKYFTSPRKERERFADREINHYLRQKELEKRDFGDLLKESPHFAEKGKLSPHGKELQDEFEKMNEKDRVKAKRKLINRIQILDRSTEACKDNYQAATNYFEQGEYDIALRLMKRNIRFCERSQDSLRLAEYMDWAKRDMSNLDYEKGKVDELREIREDRDDCAKVGDHENALLFASKLTKASERFMKITYSGSQQAEVPREEKWVTPFMRQVHEESTRIEKSFTTLFKKEEQTEEDELQQQEEDQQEIDKTIAEDEIAQVHIKAGLETMAAAKNEEQEEQPEESVDYRQATQSSQEDREQQVVEIDEQEQGQLQERQAQQLLQEETTLKMAKKDRELTQRDEIERELNTRVVDRQEDLVDELERSGKITKEAADQRRDELDDLQQSDQLGKNLVEKAQKDQDFSLKSSDRSHNIRKMKTFFEQQEGPKAEDHQPTPEEERQKALRRRQEMLRQVKPGTGLDRLAA